MTIYVDSLIDHGWVRGPNCHMFTDELSLDNLHAIALAIGMRRAWFQDSQRAPHYDLTCDRRVAAIAAGAVPVTRRQAVGVWRARRQLLQEPRS